MSNEALRAYYQADNSRRAMTDPMYVPDIVRLRQKLVGLFPNEQIQMKCFNEVDADMIRVLLTPEERSRVFFSWMVHRPLEAMTV